MFIDRRNGERRNGVRVHQVRFREPLRNERVDLSLRQLSGPQTREHVLVGRSGFEFRIAVNRRTDVLF